MLVKSSGQFHVTRERKSPALLEVKTEKLTSPAPVKTPWSVASAAVCVQSQCRHCGASAPHCWGEKSTFYLQKRELIDSEPPLFKKIEAIFHPFLSSFPYSISKLGAVR